MERPLPDPLLLTAGKLTRKVIAPVHEAHLRHRLVKPLLILRVAVQKVRQHDIFIHSQHRKFVTFSWENQTFFQAAAPLLWRPSCTFFLTNQKQITCIRIVKSQDTG